MIGALSGSFACAVCFGDPSSAQTKGAIMGGLFLLAVIGTVLTAIGCTAFVWARRAAKLARENESTAQA